MVNKTLQKEQQQEKETPHQQQEDDQSQKKLKNQKPKKIDDWRTRVNWEKVHKTIAITVISLLPFFIRDMLRFREELSLQNIQMLPWSFLYKATIATLIFTGIRKAYFHLTHNFIYSHILPQYQNEERELHTRKVQKWTFDFFYYTTTTIYGYLCFGHTTWYPLQFFQKDEDDTLGLFQDWPEMPHKQDYFSYVEPFIIVQFGHHTWGLIDLWFRRKHENRIWEWVLHHFLAWSIIFYSIYFNFQICIMSGILIHDVGDIFIVMFKTYGEFSSKGIMFKYLVFQLFTGWFVSRVYLYPKVVIYPIIVYKRLHEHEAMFQLANAAYIYQAVMVSLLYFLHVYWFAQMITLLISYVKKILKESSVRRNKEEGYGNEWDYYQYNEKDGEKQKVQDKKQN